MIAPPSKRALTVLLLGNYVHDGLQSMERFADALLRELPKAEIRVELIRPVPLFGRLRPSGTGVGKWLGYLDKFLLFPFILRWKVHRLSRGGNGDSHSLVVHICDQSNAHYTRYLQRIPHLVTCNDLLAIRSARGEIPQHRTGWTGRQLQRIILGGLKRAMRVACISHATSDDFLRITRMESSKVSVIYMGQNHGYSPMEESEAGMRVRHLLPSLNVSSFLFHIGSNTWYKNRIGLLRIYKALRELNAAVAPLVMAGQPFSPEILEFLSHNALQDFVFNVTDVSNDDLRALYTKAQLLIFPSIAEGFGWPIIEAQACGCRVVTSNRAPMTEVGGSAAIYIDPENESEAARIIDNLLKQEALKRQSLVAEGLANATRFPTEKMIKEYRQIYCDLASSMPCQ